MGFDFHKKRTKEVRLNPFFLLGNTFSFFFFVETCRTLNSKFESLPKPRRPDESGGGPDTSRRTTGEERHGVFEIRRVGGDTFAAGIGLRFRRQGSAPTVERVACT